MPVQDRASLYLQFENGDVPTETGFRNLIDSALNLADTNQQTMAGALASTRLIAPVVTASQINVTNLNSLASASFAGNVAANNVQITTGLFTTNVAYEPVICSAAGSAQATANTVSAPYTRLQGITDGQATGFIIQASRIGTIRYVANETAVSGNMYPPTGGTINGGSTNAPVAIAANTAYTIYCSTSAIYFMK